VVSGRLLFCATLSVCLCRTTVRSWRGRATRRAMSVSWVSWWHSSSTTTTSTGARGSTQTDSVMTRARHCETTASDTCRATCSCHSPASAVSAIAPRPPNHCSVKTLSAEFTALSRNSAELSRLTDSSKNSRFLKIDVTCKKKDAVVIISTSVITVLFFSRPRSECWPREYQYCLI